MVDYIWLIPFFPLVGFIINGAFGGRFSKTSVSWVACLALFLSFLSAAAVFYRVSPAARGGAGVRAGDLPLDRLG